MCCSLKSEFRWGEDESHDPTSETRPIAAGDKLRTVFVPRTLSVLSPIFLPDGISSMARSCRYFYEHDPFCSWRTLLRFARCCLFLSQEALPVRGGTQTERRRCQNCATASQSTQVCARVLC